MITKEKLMSVGAEKLAEILLDLYEREENIQKSLDVIFASFDENPKNLVTMIKKELASLKRSTRFIGYYEVRDFFEKLNQMRASIAETLKEKSILLSAQFLLEFLDLHKNILNRCDDSSGLISGVFTDAVQDLGQMYQGIQLPTEDVVSLVFKLFFENSFGIYDRIILHFKASLKEDGLQSLKEKMINAFTEEDLSAVKRALKDIADCQKDVEGYIEACSLKGGPMFQDYFEIAKRFIQKGNGEKAIEWLDSMESTNNPYWKHDERNLRIQALELCGKKEEAQAERLSWFEETLSFEIYEDILKQSHSDFKESFQDEAIQKAFDARDSYRALNFLIKIEAFEEAAKFVRLKKETFNGENYSMLRPVADSLREIDPLAATLLYRELIRPILEETKYNNYNYAAKDLVMCERLALKIRDWTSFDTHNAYFDGLLTQHKRKVAFWAKYKTALEKKAAKEEKQAQKEAQKINKKNSF